MSNYSTPKVYTLGTVQELTSQDLDKVGSSSDFLTLLLPDLNGKIINDPTP
jgi:hypothetical protein